MLAEKIFNLTLLHSLMKQIENVYSVVKQITQVINMPELQIEVQNLSRLRQPVINQQSVPQLVATLDRIIQIVGKIDTTMWSDDHRYIAEKLGLMDLIGERGRRYFENIKNNVLSSNQVDINIISNITNQINQLRTKPTQLLSLLGNFEIESNIDTLKPDEGVVEIVFDGGVAIDDFKEAKDQMSDWFIIIEGYARLLGVSREEFEIINISKNSPTKFKIKTSLTNAGLFLGIVTSLLVIEKTYLENKLTIEKLKSTELVPDNKAQIIFIQTAEKHMDEKIKKEIEDLVDEKIKEFKIPEGNGDIKNNLAKGIENQYNFMINGGTVNIHVIDEKMKKDVDTLEKAKEEIKLIKTAYENQKAIPNSQDKNVN